MDTHPRGFDTETGCARLVFILDPKRSSGRLSSGKACDVINIERCEKCRPTMLAMYLASRGPKGHVDHGLGWSEGG